MKYFDNKKKHEFEGSNGYYFKLGELDGLIFAMKVTEHQTPEGHTEYKCLGYARLNGVNIAEWTYWAIDYEEVISNMTRDYLIRELMPLARTWSKFALDSVRIWSNSGKDLVRIPLDSGSNLVAAQVII
jgi:hypothetical protein